MAEIMLKIFIFLFVLLLVAFLFLKIGPCKKKYCGPLVNLG